MSSRYDESKNKDRGEWQRLVLLAFDFTEFVSSTSDGVVWDAQEVTFSIKMRYVALVLFWTYFLLLSKAASRIIS